MAPLGLSQRLPTAKPRRGQLGMVKMFADIRAAEVRPSFRLGV